MKKVQFKTANSIGHFEVPDDAEITAPEGVTVNAEEGIEPMMLNAEEAMKAAKADMSKDELAKYEDDNNLLLPTDVAVRSERKFADDETEEIEPLISPNM